MHKNIMLYIISLLVGLIMCELALAIFLPQPKEIIKSPYFFSEHDQEIGWVLKKNSKGLHQPNRSEPAVLVEINSKGFRGKEFTGGKAPEKKRIVILGDSITFGYGLDEKATYPAMLQGLLGDSYEVINSGVVGYGIDQQYLYFKREVIQYLPDIVIVGFSAGDIYDSICSRRFNVAKPFFRLVDGRLVYVKPPAIKKATIREVFFRDKPVQAFFFNNSNLYRFIFYRVADLDKIMNINTEEMNLVEGMELVKVIINSLKKDCEQIKCKLLFLAIPQENWFDSSSGGEAFKHGHNAATAVLEETGVPYIDLWEPFIKESGKGLFLKGDPVHTNQRGNRIIADALYHRLTVDKW